MPGNVLPTEPGVERVAAANVHAAVDGTRCCGPAGHLDPWPLDLDGREHMTDPVAAPAKVESGAPASPGQRVWSDRLAGLGALTY
jgi:hypothetical protein